MPFPSFSFVELVVVEIVEIEIDARFGSSLNVSKPVTLLLQKNHMQTCACLSEAYLVQKPNGPRGVKVLPGALICIVWAVVARPVLLVVCSHFESVMFCIVSNCVIQVSTVKCLCSAGTGTIKMEQAPMGHDQHRRLHCWVWNSLEFLRPKWGWNSLAWKKWQTIYI